MNSRQIIENWIQFTIALFFFYSNIQRQDGHMQRFIREVNTTSRSCVLWDLEEDTNYIIQVQSIGLYGESQASKKVHFHTLKKSDRFPSNSSNQGMVLWDLEQNSSKKKGGGESHNMLWVIEAVGRHDQDYCYAYKSLRPACLRHAVERKTKCGKSRILDSSAKRTKWFSKWDKYVDCYCVSNWIRSSFSVRGAFNLLISH